MLSLSSGILLFYAAIIVLIKNFSIYVNTTQQNPKDEIQETKSFLWMV